MNFYNMYKDKLHRFLEKKSDKKKLIVIFWPTASGKTDMSIDIALELDSEIISTDSRQIFRELDIGTGKITRDEMQGIKHHMIDIVNPNKSFSLGEFQSRAENIMQELWSRDRIPLLVWGTWLYIESLIFDFDMPRIPADTKLRAELDMLSNDELYKKLQEIDSDYAQELHPNNRPYVERAIEVKMLTGKSKKDFRTEKSLRYDTLFLYPQMPEGYDVFSPEYRAWLYERINLRVELMFENWLEEELRELLKKWYHFNDFGLNSIGYREFEDYFSWDITREELIEKIRQNSRKYAKRQITWFRKYEKYL